MNNFPIRVCWFELGEGQLGFQAALVYISRIPRSVVLRKILNKSPRVHGISVPLPPGWAAFSNCHLLNLLKGKEPINQLFHRLRLIFWGRKQGVILVDTEYTVTPEHSQSIPLRLGQNSPDTIKTPPPLVALQGPVS